MDLTSVISHLPPEIAETVRGKSIKDSLVYLSTQLLDLQQTDTLLPILQVLLPDLVARWSSLDRVATVIAAYGRIIPFQSHLSDYPSIFLRRHRLGREIWNTWSEQTLLEYLLGLYRLSMADSQLMLSSIRPVDLMFGLNHDSRPVRYLVIRLLCLFLHAADYACCEMVAKYLGDGPIYGSWDSKGIDYRFFSLWEYQRYKTLKATIDREYDPPRGVYSSSTASDAIQLVGDEDLEQSIAVAGILVPKPFQQHPMSASIKRNSSSVEYVNTNTTAESMRNFAQALLDPKPVLLYGESGSGKSTMVNFLAKKLNKMDSMITLHLNEQSDAKVLLGLYTSGSSPGKFTWKPGVLTTAVREGRWVLIEDLDRAPNEIISTLLPLIERGELCLPGRGETVPTASGFKLIATVRISTKQGRELDMKNMIGMRFWNLVPVALPTQTELISIIATKFPELSPHAKSFMAMYQEVGEATSSRLFITKARSAATRPLSPRDLLKWCRRIAPLFRPGRKYTEEDHDTLLLEAADCFAGHINNEESFEEVIAIIARHLEIDSQRFQFVLHKRQIKLDSREGTARPIQLGRVVLPSMNTSHKRGSFSRPFSMNPHTLRLLERIASAMRNKEPLLLVGETGTGKTTCVQQLAAILGKRLLPFNLSQQSEGSDLLGGFKPVNIRALAMAIQEEFEQLFLLSFSQKENAQFVELLTKCLAKGQWKRVCRLWRGAANEVSKSIAEFTSEGHEEDTRESKRQKTDGEVKEGSQPLKNPLVRSRWLKLSQEIKDLESRLKSSGDTVAFTFVEGNLVKAIRNGDWVLLDEINLAPADTLETLFDLLQGTDDGSTPSILLTESGKVERIVAHPDFQLFAAMNPATDIGKTDLPPGIRSRFTEIYVESPDKDLKSLQHIVQTYLGEGLIDKTVVSQMANLYLQVQKLSESNSLVDGVGQQPHFSLRTLTRCLTFAQDVASLCGLKRGLYEGFHMSFMTYLDRTSEDLLAPLILEHIFGKRFNVKSGLNKPLRMPSDGRKYIQQGSFWLRQGQHVTMDQRHYIITPFVQRNLDNLIRAVFSRRYPILIQGPTSSGKTSMIEYLAKVSGHKFVRVNNHEHTDLQEYLGSYVSDANGQLRFQEGILVQALRNGYWIVLDELNLAPSDILEALNRLLDDNRELFIPETQETVKPHEDFMLFATQNPAGLYGGRKPLSRAFRNRFLELHFDDIPVDELCEILQRRTQIPESWGRRIVEVYKELSTLRQENRLFEQHSFATLRDLFRWALRKAETVEELAINGYMLLAERVRKPEERRQVKEVIETVMSRRGPKIRVDLDSLYSEARCPEIGLFKSRDSSQKVVWTNSMRRLYVLVSYALRNNEPVLLIGETGCGKTTVCQMLADTFSKELHIVNAHQNTETGDLIGLQRPVRNRGAIEQELREALQTAFGIPQDIFVYESTESLLEQCDKAVETNSIMLSKEVQDQIHRLRSRWTALFEWRDGSLVSAMKSGQFFLLDEISLADDSVLERLNSVLEPERTVFLAEKGPVNALVSAADGFQFLATMNPGGDYGKRELSPALRNRFTEIWVPSILDIQDIKDIIQSKLIHQRKHLTEPIVNFAQWFTKNYTSSESSAISVRDVLSTVDFVNTTEKMGDSESLLHGLAMVFIDTLGANPSGLISINPLSLASKRQECVAELESLIQMALAQEYSASPSMELTEHLVTVGMFSLTRISTSATAPEFTFLAPTTRVNAMRIIRALQLPKPILIEGDPGVGKTTLVATITRLAGKRLVRMNLSDQTDLMDLFGFDAPIDGGSVGHFTWRDAPFLKAMKEGDWVLLDEMNLASQSVLEGLNACLDHRGEAYIAELNQTFQRHPDFRLFAAQNPHHQGGGRKGLPASFVNRFTVVYADAFGQEDLNTICQELYPQVDKDLIEKLTRFVGQLDIAIRQKNILGASGNPWEINLRDTLRWLHLAVSGGKLVCDADPYDLCNLVFRRRFRSMQDSAVVDRLFRDTFDMDPHFQNFVNTLKPEGYQVGWALIDRKLAAVPCSAPRVKLPNSHISILEAMILCLEHNWPILLVGPSGGGKSTLVNHLAAICGANVIHLSINAETDSMDLVGGYEQVDPQRSYLEYMSGLEDHLRQKVCLALGYTKIGFAIDGIECLELLATSASITQPAATRIKAFLQNCWENSKDKLTKSFYDKIDTIASLPSVSETAKFEWVDGLLVKAAERGDWVVLDNANLCSASVLDRLNSLLEPNGVLSVNEHPLPNGETRIIKPHPNFRVFMTMDPRYGELSSAMRNRSMELYVPLDPQHKLAYNPAISVADSVAYRMSQTVDALSALPLPNGRITYDLAVALDHISSADVKVLAQLREQLQLGLIPDIHPDVIENLPYQRLFNQTTPNLFAQCFDAARSRLKFGDYRDQFMVNFFQPTLKDLF
jgi:midasin